MYPREYGEFPHKTRNWIHIRSRFFRGAERDVLSRRANILSPCYFHPRRCDTVIVVVVVAVTVAVVFASFPRHIKFYSGVYTKENAQRARVLRHAPNNIFKRQQSSTGQALLRYLPQHICESFSYCGGGQRVRYSQFANARRDTLAIFYIPVMGSRAIKYCIDHKY